MPQVLERKTTDKRQSTKDRPPVERRPQPERRSTTRFVRWLGWLTALLVIAGAGWWGWSVATSDDVTPAVAERSTDELIRATSGYGEIGTLAVPSADVEGAVLPTVGMWDYVSSLGEKDYAWVATAEHLGYTVDGLWISADGQTWEHIDGTVVTVEGALNFVEGDGPD